MDSKVVQEEREIESSPGTVKKRLRLGMVFTLVIFWTILSGTLHWHHLLLGILSSLMIVLFWGDFLFKQREGLPLNFRRVVLFVHYLIFFLVEVVKANIDVAKIVLNPKLPITPLFIRFRPELNRTLSKVILANSITLTPGTLSVYLYQDEIIVHALTREAAEDVHQCIMKTSLQRIEEEGP